MKFECPICGCKYSFSPIKCRCGHSGPFAMIPDDDGKTAPASAETLIGFLAGMVAWIMTHDGIAGVIAGLAAFFVASTKAGMLAIRVALLLGLVWLALAYFG